MRIRRRRRSKNSSRRRIYRRRRSFNKRRRSVRGRRRARNRSRRRSRNWLWRAKAGKYAGRAGRGRRRLRRIPGKRGWFSNSRRRHRSRRKARNRGRRYGRRYGRNPAALSIKNLPYLFPVKIMQYILSHSYILSRSFSSMEVRKVN